MEKKLNKKRVKKNKKPKNVLVITTIYVICFSVIAGVFAYTRINKYEEGVLLANPMRVIIINTS